MTIKKVNIEELRDFVEVAYNGDAGMLNKYHINKYTLSEAVEKEISIIEFTSSQVNMSCFGLVENGEKIGYMCVFQNNLYSFGINIEKRTKDILAEFWNNVKEVLGESFITMLFPNNTRAINWLKRCGMVEVDGVEENCVTLLKI